jgi:hypothetical protein
MSGKELEATVREALTTQGFTSVKYSKWTKNKEKYGKELLLEHVPFKSIYHHKGFTEFLLKSEKHGLNIRIECKWQTAKGSVDEKLPYLYLNCVKAMPEKTVMVVIDGPGWKDGAIEWLKKKAQQNQNTDKTVLVFSVKELKEWIDGNFSSEKSKVKE